MDRAALMAAMVAAQSPTPITIKGWGSFHVREMSARESSVVRKAIEAGKTAAEPLDDVVYYSASVICDEAGVLLFDVRSQADLEFLAGMGSTRLGRVLGAVNKLAAEDEEGKA